MFPSFETPTVDQWQETLQNPVKSEMCIPLSKHFVAQDAVTVSVNR
jgi:hypothetical protein